MLGMDPRPSTSAPRTRKSRAERKQETRDALIVAAIATFARDGYHGASLDGIANEAGLSKGAVYSNFDNKAQLFLAVMDYNLQALRGQGWDPLAAPETGEACTPESGATRDDAADMVRGFGLATLEFIATAARDDTLIQELRERIQVLLDAYTLVAEAGRPPGETLPASDIARLMAALEQGTSVLALSGVDTRKGAHRGHHQVLAKALHHCAP
jgi:AcrR family transcriptional regulator